MVSSKTQSTHEQSPIHVLAKLNIAWLQWSYENWYFRDDKLLRQKFFLWNTARLGYASVWKKTITKTFPGSTQTPEAKKKELQNHCQSDQ